MLPEEGVGLLYHVLGDPSAQPFFQDVLKKEKFYLHPPKNKRVPKTLTLTLVTLK